jgi:Zinc carboxypeptidase
MAFKSGFVTNYLDPLKVEEEVRDLIQRFPDLCRLEDLPFESHGYWGEKQQAFGRHRMRVFHVTSPRGPKTKPAVLLMRSHHAREWINSIAVIETARQLVENYRPEEDDPRVKAVVTMLDRVEFMFVPEGNPDGACLSFFDAEHRMWRKNLRPLTSTTCVGVDCNRNYPRYWGEAGSSDSPCSDAYRGPSALCEPESQNIAHLVGQCRNIVFAIDSHSFGQSIYRPNPRGGQFVSELPVSPEDDAIYVHLERQMNNNIKLVGGIEYSTGSTSNHAGTSDEFFFFNHRIFGFNLECGTDFQPPLQDAVTASLEVAQAALALAWCATGETGLNVNAFMERRKEVVTDFALELFEQQGALEPYQPESLPKEQLRRFRVRFAPLRSESAAQEALDLISQECDLIKHSPVGIELIASSREIETLRRRGYRPIVVRDYYSEQHQQQ